MHETSAEDVAWLRNNADHVVPMSDRAHAAAARNRGLAVAAGRHVVFADDTIRFSPGWLDEVGEVLDAHSGIGAYRLPVGDEPGVERVGDETNMLAPFSVPLTPGLLIVDAEVLRRLGGWDETYPSIEVAELHMLFQLWSNGFEVGGDAQVAGRRETVSVSAGTDRGGVPWSGLDALVDHWTAPRVSVPYLGACAEDDFAHNVSRAAEAAAALGRVVGQGAAAPAELARRYLDARQTALQLEARNSQLLEQRRALRHRVTELSRPAPSSASVVVERGRRAARRVVGKARRLVPGRRGVEDPPESSQGESRTETETGGAAHPRRARYESALARSAFSGRGRRSVAFAVSTTNLDAGRGDVFVAVGLGLELERLGYDVVYVESRSWYRLPAGCDLLVAMLPDFDPSRLPQRLPTVAWVRNETDRWIQQPHLGFFDLVLCSSGASEHAIREVYPGPTEILAIGVDTALFDGAGDAPRAGVSTTVNQWGMEREVYSGLRSAPIDFPLDIYGQGRGFPAEVLAHWRGPVSFFDLPAIYSRSRLVLDDFNHTTAAYGNVNSRVFEALAAGALPITNRRAGLQEVGLGEVPTYSGRHGLLPLVRRLIDDPATASLASRLSAHVRRHHSFERRAAQFDASTRDLAPAERTTVVTVASASAAVEEWYSDLAAAGGWLLRSSPVEFPIDVARSERFGPSILHLIGTEALRTSHGAGITNVEIETSLRECLERGTPLVFSASDPADVTVRIPGLTPPTLAGQAAVHHPMTDGPHPAMTLPLPDPWLSLRRAQRHALGVDSESSVCVVLDPADATPYQAAFVGACESSPGGLRLVVAGEVGPDAWHPVDGVICRLHPLDDRDRRALIAAADVVLMMSDAPHLLAIARMAHALGCPVGVVQVGPRAAALDTCTWLQRDELEGFVRDVKPRGQLPYASLSDSVLSAVDAS